MPIYNYFVLKSLMILFLILRKTSVLIRPHTLNLFSWNWCLALTNAFLCCVVCLVSLVWPAHQIQDLQKNCQLILL